MGDGRGRPGRIGAAASSLSPLMARQLALSRRRAASIDATLAQGASGRRAERLRAAREAEAVLTGELPASVEVGSYVARIATLQQLASGVIGCVMTRTVRLALPARRARAMAFAVRALMSHLETCVKEGGSIDVQLVLGRDRGGVTLALGAVGDLWPVGSASGTLALVRARAILEALGGEFQRGLDAHGRMVFGAILPDG